MDFCLYLWQCRCRNSQMYFKHIIILGSPLRLEMEKHKVGSTCQADISCPARCQHLGGCSFVASTASPRMAGGSLCMWIRKGTATAAV